MYEEISGIIMKQSQRNTSGEQYFSATPNSEDIRRSLEVTLRDYPVRVETSHGVFSGSRVDLGTSVLLKHAPQLPEEGTFLDIGCGWGPIAIAMAKESPDARVYAVDVNERAIELTHDNAQANDCNNIIACTAEQVPEDTCFDVIWSNPPIRVGKDVLHDLLMQWLPRLREGGYAYLVVQKNLGSDSLMAWLREHLPQDMHVEKYSSSKGYRVIEVSRDCA